MCGRFTNQYTWRELHALYKLSDETFPVSNLRPHFNFAPTQTGVVVRLDKQGRRVADMMRWGLVPYWSKDDKDGAKMINAKAETVAEKPAYRKAFQSRPCLVPADGFFEWQRLPNGEKQPYFTTTQFQEPFAFAGLWERWHAPDAVLDAPPLETFAILTTEPNALCAPIHDRMPVMLAQDDWTGWLGTPEQRKVLAPRQFPAERMECWPISKAVGNVKNDDPSLMQRA